MKPRPCLKQVDGKKILVDGHLVDGHENWTSIKTWLMVTKFWLPIYFSCDTGRFDALFYLAVSLGKETYCCWVVLGHAYSV